jgi:formylglycine-generating enzyme required for sulfatase activity
MGSNPSYFQGAANPDASIRPVEQVSWNAVQGFLAATSLRLPTEAEWEFACRAGTTTPIYAIGSQTLDSIAWFTDNSAGQTHAVGGKAANALGFHDMLGNVWEWNSDWVGPYSPAAQTDPQGPVSGSVRVIRGRSWGDFGLLMRSSGRADAGPNYADFYDGFRVARNP